MQGNRWTQRNVLSFRSNLDQQNKEQVLASWQEEPFWQIPQDRHWIDHSLRLKCNLNGQAVGRKAKESQRRKDKSNLQNPFTGI